MRPLIGINQIRQQLTWIPSLTGSISIWWRWRKLWEEIVTEYRGPGDSAFSYSFSFVLIFWHDRSYWSSPPDSCFVLWLLEIRKPGCTVGLYNNYCWLHCLSNLFMLHIYLLYTLPFLIKTENLCLIKTPTRPGPDQELTPSVKYYRYVLSIKSRRNQTKTRRWTNTMTQHFSLKYYKCVTYGHQKTEGRSAAGSHKTWIDTSTHWSQQLALGLWFKS